MPLTPRRSLAAGAVALATVGGLATVAGGASSSHDGYRTATVGVRSVDQVLDGVATVEPVDQSTVAFPMAGTVESVSVRVGDTVRVGDELASLDDAALQRTLHSKQAALDQAELNLERALNGEAVEPSTGDGGDLGSGDVIPTSASTDTTVELDTELVAYVQSSGPSDGEIAAAQQAVVAAQAQVDSATAAADAAIANAASVCAAVASADQAGFPAALTACTDAITAATAAQAAVSQAQAAVSSASANLDSLLDARAQALAEQPTEPTTPTTPTTPSTPSGGTGGLEGGSLPSTGGASPSTGGSSATAEQLISYQRQVDAAALEVIVAQQAIAQATIVSPIRGTVVGVNMVSGEDVEAASSTANVVVVGRGGYEATFSVSVDDLPDLEVGQAAEVTADGQAEPLAGEVVAIGVQANSGAYPVSVGLTDGGRGLGNGATASVSITTDAADEVLAVPTSAVTVDGEQASVQLLEGGEATSVDVEIGAIGDTWTEVTSGLEEGQEVALADLDEPLPGSATDTSGNGTDQIFGGGGPPDFGGGGGPVIQFAPGG